MARKIVTAEELAKLDPEARDALLGERMITDEDQDPAVFAWARDAGRRILQEQGHLPTTTAG